MSLCHSQPISHNHIHTVESTQEKIAALDLEMDVSYDDDSDESDTATSTTNAESSSMKTKTPQTASTLSLTLPKMNSQNELLMQNLMQFYADTEYMDTMIKIINGESNISLRIIDWFATNYAKKHFTVYEVKEGRRFKVYIDYKLKLKAYSKKRFDPFCRWERISIPYKDDCVVQTTLGQLNFFKWAIENRVIQYIEENYSHIERDMNSRNSTAKNNNTNASSTNKNKTRKKREELSISAAKSIKKENVHIKVTFN